ncbi:MAG: MFS transporter, partial [Bacilli bacterium]
KQLFQNRVFLIITLTDLIQMLGIWIRNIAILFFVMRMTNDNPNAVSAITFIEMAPMVLFSFIGGVLADRWNPKRTMITGDVLSMLSFAILGLLIEHLPWWMILFATLVSAVVTQFSYPSSSKYLKASLPDSLIEKAVSFNQGLASVFPIVGPAIGAFFYYQFDMRTILFIVAALYVVSIALLTRLPNRKWSQPTTNESMFQAMTDSLRYIAKTSYLRMLALSLIFIGLAIGFASTLDIFLVTERLGLAQSVYPWFAGVAGVGMIVGSLVYMVWSETLGHMRMMIGISLLLAVTFVAEGYSTIPALTISLQFFDNFIGGILSAYLMGTFTRHTDEAYIGRVSGFISFLWFLSIMIASGLAGPLMSVATLPFVYVLAGVGMLLTAFIFYRFARSTPISANTEQSQVS